MINIINNTTVGTQHAVSKNRARHIVPQRPIIVNDIINNIGMGEAFLKSNQLDKRNSKKNASPIQNHHLNILPVGTQHAVSKMNL